jgi:hypothetical protein
MEFEMRELTAMELGHVSGAGFFSRLGAAKMGALWGFTAGLLIGGSAAGRIGGFLGVGAITGLVGLIVGGVVGPFAGASYGLAYDWDKTTDQIAEWVNNLAKGGGY